MKAAVLHQLNQPFQIEDLDLAEPGCNEVLVDIKATGICHSDWHVVTGETKHPLPVVMGHEGAGIVAGVGPGVTRVEPGDHVILNWAPNCGDCYYCLRERPNLCDTYVEPIWAGTMMDGTTRLRLGGKPVYHFSGIATFAERTVVPDVSCVKIDKNTPFPVAALVGCAVTTGVGAVLKTVSVRPGDHVVVYGCGGVGLNIIQAAGLAGATRVIAVDRFPGKLELAKQFGASDGLIAGDSTLDEIRALTGGRGADYVFEAIGIPSVQEHSLHAVRPGGALVLVGLSPMGSATDFPAAILTRQEKRVIGSYYGTANTQRDFVEFLGLYHAGKLDLDALISREYRLEEINEGYEALVHGDGVARGVITF